MADAAAAAQVRHDVGAAGAALGAVDAREAGAALAAVGGAGALLEGEALEVAARRNGDVVAGVTLRRGGEEGDGEEEEAELHCCFSWGLYVVLEKSVRSFGKRESGADLGRCFWTWVF